MDTHPEQRIQELRTLISRGDYVVDPNRVADAVMQCVSALALAHENGHPAPQTRHRHRRIRAGLRGTASRCRAATTPVVAAAS